MEQYTFLLPIAALLLFGAITPGPSFILVAQTAMSKSRLEAIFISIGLGLGASLFALIASMGLIALFNAVPDIYVALKIIGGCYLCYLGLKMWRSDKSNVSIEQTPVAEKPALFHSFLVGLTTQLSNPKTAIVFSSVFATLLPEHVPAGTTPILVIGIFILNFSWYCTVSFILSSPSAQARYLRFNLHINKGLGLLLGAIGSKFVIEGAKPQ